MFYPGHKWNIQLASILTIEENPELCAAAAGIKFSTSFSHAVVIRRRGLTVKLSPEHPVEFCQHVRYAMSPGSYVLPTKM